ncbi:hypothetical protein PRZ48_000117 [Zasmidium cellare]|uniref:Uncharacterized protein n=1 Tax=Zasmidium cellare TaxID=395010 RepID=A0ABR0EXL3_ZASCE|nr:hypothetical protein PRZ48_000117 [Zasmidium cellare]
MSHQTTHSFLLNPFNPTASPSDPGPLSPSQKDTFYTYQLSLPTGPYGFDKESLWASTIIQHKHLSSNVFHTLQHIGVLDKERGNVVDTSKIGPKFTHQLAEIPARQQKRVVDLLFWWEEECQRLRKLHDEQTELEGLLRTEQGEERRIVLGKLLERVKGKVRARPSERVERVERDEDELVLGLRGVGGEGDLPAYSRT